MVVVWLFFFIFGLVAISNKLLDLDAWNLEWQQIINRVICFVSGLYKHLFEITVCIILKVTLEIGGEFFFPQIFLLEYFSRKISKIGTFFSSNTTNR